MSTEDLAQKALRNAMHEHTTRAILLLAKYYKFDPAEALEKAGLPVRSSVPLPFPPSRDPVPVHGTSSEDEQTMTIRRHKPRLTACKSKTRTTRKKRAQVSL